jgi:hypothetical protein
MPGRAIPGAHVALEVIMFELTTDPGHPLPGDDLLPDAKKQITRSMVIDATPETIWPFLVEMTRLDGDQGRTVLRAEPPRTLLLGGLHDHGSARDLPFEAPRSESYWQATWVLVLSPIDEKRTRLDVRSRVAFAGEAVQWASIWTHPFHDFMAPDQLGRLGRAAEGASPAGVGRSAG